LSILSQSLFDTLLRRPHYANANIRGAGNAISKPKTDESKVMEKSSSQHKKKVLNDFFRKARSGAAKEPKLTDYSSRLNRLAEFIDFELDDLEKRVEWHTIANSSI
jgi:hypothetical protein